MEGRSLSRVADRDKPEALPIIRKLAEVGYELYATEGTAAMIKAVEALLKGNQIYSAQPLPDYRKKEPA